MKISSHEVHKGHNGLRDLGVLCAIQAASSLGHEELVHAIAAEIAPTSENALPTDIQWMPPGEHEIEASQGGKPVKKKVRVNAATAARVQKDFLEIKAAADAGNEDQPYFDLNHDDKEASAHPTEYFWGGDHPQQGGVRAKLQWTGAGEGAVKGKTFRRFSPTFFINAGGDVSLKHPSGALAVNQGGMVNRAAFKQIAPIWSKAASADGDPAEQETKTTEKENNLTMKSLLAVLAKLGLTTSAEVDEATAVTQVTAKHAELTSSATTAQSELTQVKAKLTDTETKLDASQTSFATATVDAAISAGKIPGQDETLKAKWVGLIKADPTNASLLPDPNPALQTLVKAGSAKDGTKSSAAGGGEHAFMVKAKEYEAEKKVSAAFAATTVARQNPALYDEYRATLGLGGN